jgi:DNA-binding SARP family transcriptional activator
MPSVAEQDGVVRFRVLGPLELLADGTWAGISAPKWRSLLAALLINAGQVVPTDRLILEIWGDTPPAKATNLVSVYALRVRRLLGDEHGEVLRTRSPGYQLRVAQQDVDALCFDALVANGRQALAAGEMPRAAALLTEALGLWHGSAFLDVPASALVTAEAGRLERARLDALELRIEADIGCGWHAQVIPELFRLTAEQPMREGLWGLLMRALDGAGRHAEALAVYGKAREAIADELGVDPGEQLQRLFQDLLTRDTRRQEKASVAPSPAGSEPSGPAGPSAPAAVAEPPGQLPADIADFTGRARDVQRLCDLAPAGPDAGLEAGAVEVALVAGAGGLGKTTLAVHVAHRLRPHFPDGQLYVNLLGASPQPLSPGDVLARFLRDLGVSSTQIPVDPDERAALLRTRLTGRRVLMVLDDARDSAQIRPLLPGSGSCAVIVTTRGRLPDLASTRLVDLDVLEDAEARTLLRTIVGAERTDAEAAATDEVLADCAGLPLAIRIAGARLTARAGWSVRTLASRLRSEQRRLDELKVGDLAVRATFEVSFASLPGPSRPGAVDPARAFRLLGLWGGPVISLPAAAALFGQPDDDAEDALEQLVDAHLLESPAPGAYRFHDLLRVYAAERSRAEPAPETREAARRILTWYLHTTEAAARIISPHHTRVPVGAALPDIRPGTFGSLDEALGWCDSERANLVAAVRQAADAGLHDIAWRLAAAEMSFFYRRSHWADWIGTHQTGLASARELGDRLAEAWMLNNLGMVYGALNRSEAVDRFEQAVAIYRAIGDGSGEARALNNLIHAQLQQGRFDEALEAGQSSLAVQQRVGNRFGLGVTRAILGGAFRGLGRFTEAVEQINQALVVFRELDDKPGEADLLSDLGEVYVDLQRVGDAVDCLRESLSIRQLTGDRHGQARSLAILGLARREGGDVAEARRALAEACQIFEEVGDHDRAAEIRSELAELAGAVRLPASGVKGLCRLS